MKKVTGGCRRLQGATSDYMGLQGVTGGNKGLKWIKRGYRVLQGVKGGYKRVIRGYKRFEGFTGG